MPVRISRSISSAAIGMGSAVRLHELAAGLDALVLERLADAGFVAFDAGRDEVAEDLADHVFVAGFLEIGADDVFGIGLGLDVAEAHEAGRPAAEEAVAPRDYLELHRLIARIVGLECPLAVVESAHVGPLSGVPLRQIGPDAALRN